MGFIIIIPFAALAGWSIFAILRWLIRGGYALQWRKRLIFLLSAGIALGVWLAFFTHYRIGNTQLDGFPIPIGITTREKKDAPWVKSEMPATIRIGGSVTDLLAGAAICLAPLALAAFLRENLGQKDALVPPVAQPRS